MIVGVRGRPELEHSLDVDVTATSGTVSQKMGLCPVSDEAWADSRYSVSQTLARFPPRHPFGTV